MRERDALAKSLRKEGQEGRGRRPCGKLAKPTVVAALVNRLAREASGDVAKLLQAADALKAAQVGGKGDFAEAAAAERDALQKLVRKARALDPDASDAALDRVSGTLRAAAADDEARALLERGVLTREVEASGFGSLLASMPAGPAKRRPAAKSKRAAEDAAKKRERAKAEQEVERLRAQGRARGREGRRGRGSSPCSGRGAGRGRAPVGLSLPRVGTASCARHSEEEAATAAYGSTAVRRAAWSCRSCSPSC